MNIEQANSIPLSEILDKLNIKPVIDKGIDVWYLSPFRNEDTASFHINTRKNKWYDFGEFCGGDVVSFFCKYLELSGRPATASDALGLAAEMYAGQIPSFKKPEPASTDNEPALTIKRVESLWMKGLLNYVIDRGIPSDIAIRNLSQIHVHNRNTGKTFRALGFKNEEGGWELRNSFFKGTIRPKYISFRRGEEKAEPDGIHIFEGFMDYLTAIAAMEGKGFKDDAIILNSLSSIPKSLTYLRNYGYKTIYTWFDNDIAGKKATTAFGKFVETEANLIHKDRSTQYPDHKDLNEWWMAKKGLKGMANDE